MFQRLSSLFFGSVEDVAPELKGPKPSVIDADEEGWLLVNLPGEEGMEASAVARPRTECYTHALSPPAFKTRRTRSGRTRLVHPSSHSTSSPPDPTSFSHLESVEVNVWLSERDSGSCSDCSMDESWFVTPPPCFTAEGATAETSPMEDLLIEHPSMSVYISPGLPSIEESATSLTGSIRMSESAVSQSAAPARKTRGTAAQAGALAKVTQVTRVQRAKARIERRHLGRNCVQRQNHVRENVKRRAVHTRNSFLHQPFQRNFCH